MDVKLPDLASLALFSLHNFTLELHYGASAVLALARTNIKFSRALIVFYLYVIDVK